MRYVLNGLLIIVICGFGIPLATSLLSTVVFGIVSLGGFHPEPDFVLVGLGFLIFAMVGAAGCIWAGYDSARSLGLRPALAGLYGGLLVWIGSLIYGALFSLVFQRPHRVAHNYPTSYLIFGWLTWLAVPAAAVFFAYVGASWAHRRHQKQADTEEGFNSEIDQEPEPYVEDDQPQDL